jgi:acylpyruvate hydrolase
MRFTTIRTEDGNRAGRVEGDAVVLLPFADVGELVASGPDWQERGSADTGESVALESVDFATLVPRPEKIFCVGLNTATHAAEANLDLPEYPVLFAKFARSLIGANDDIVLPSVADQVDWEVELAAVIGKPLRHVDEQEAEAGIAGYTIANDISVRDWQLRTTQFLQGKTFEGSTPVGPYLVTPDEANGGWSLDAELKVDGVVRQAESTDGLHFSIPHVVSYISSIITLVPGDLILSGTSAGVGHCMTPQTHLRSGNVVEASIELLGAQRNACVEEVFAAG